MAQNKAMHERTGGGIGDGNGLSWSITYANVIKLFGFCSFRRRQNKFCRSWQNKWLSVQTTPASRKKSRDGKSSPLA